MHRFPRPPLLVVLFCAAVWPVAAAAPAVRPWESGSLDLESGLLWQVGENTPLPYRLVPTQLSWRSAEVFGRALDDGSRLLVRHRLTLLGTWIPSGPESRYLGVAGSPSLEWWNRAGTRALFAGAGGGVGWIDARGVPGGQGQDFTLNWFARGGVEHVSAGGTRWSAGVMFHHLSNGGQTEPNPGIDALGFTLGWSRAF